MFFALGLLVLHSVKLKVAYREVFRGSEAVVKMCINGEILLVWVKTSWIYCSISKSISSIIRDIKLEVCCPKEIVEAITVDLRGR